MDECKECGMHIETNEFHPYLACLAFKGCHDSEVVRANMSAIRNSGIEYCARVLDIADKNDHPSDLADRLRKLKSA